MSQKIWLLRWIRTYNPSVILSAIVTLDGQGPNGIGKIYGQEKNVTAYNLARMNMVLHGVKDTEFGIYHGDTPTNDRDMLRETNPAKKPHFDAGVANPPFSFRRDPNEALGEDVRFKNYGWLRSRRRTSRFCWTGLTT